MAITNTKQREALVNRLVQLTRAGDIDWQVVGDGYFTVYQGFDINVVDSVLKVDSVHVRDLQSTKVKVLWFAIKRMDVEPVDRLITLMEDTEQ